MDSLEVQEPLWLMRGLLEREGKSKLRLSYPPLLCTMSAFSCGNFRLLGNMLKLTKEYFRGSELVCTSTKRC